MGNRMGAILKPSDQQGCHIWYYSVARSSVDPQTSPTAVIPRVTERRSACSKFFHDFLFCTVSFYSREKKEKRDSSQVWQRVFDIQKLCCVKYEMLISCEKCKIFLVSNQHIYTIQLLFRDGMKDLLFTDLKFQPPFWKWFLSIFTVTSKQIQILNPSPPQPHSPNKKNYLHHLSAFRNY